MHRWFVGKRLISFRVCLLFLSSFFSLSPLLLFFITFYLCLLTFDFFLSSFSLHSFLLTFLLTFLFTFLFWVFLFFFFHWHIILNWHLADSHHNHSTPKYLVWHRNIESDKVDKRHIFGTIVTNVILVTNFTKSSQMSQYPIRCPRC